MIVLRDYVERSLMKLTKDPSSKTRLRAQIRTQVLPNRIELQRGNLSF